MSKKAPRKAIAKSEAPEPPPTGADLRDTFAAHIMTGIVSLRLTQTSAAIDSPEECDLRARMAYRQADAMLEARTPSHG